MSNQENDQKMLMGVLIGGIVGVGAFSLFLATRRSKESSISTIGQAISQVGEIFESHHVEEPASLKKAGKQIDKSENTIADVAEWVGMGLELWKKLKR